MIKKIAEYLCIMFCIRRLLLIDCAYALITDRDLIATLEQTPKYSTSNITTLLRFQEC